MKSNYIRVLSLIESALAAGLTVVLVLLGLNLPSMQVVISFIWSIPLILLAIRYNLRVAALSAVAAFVLTLFYTDAIKAIIVFIQLVPLGLVYGYLIKARAKVGSIILWGSLTALISLFFVSVLGFIFFGFSPSNWIEEMQRDMQHIIENYGYEGLLNGTGTGREKGVEIEATLRGFFESLMLLTPGMLVVGTIFSALLNFFIARFVLLRLNIKVPSIPPFRHWRLPWYFIWGVIAGLVLWLLGDYWELSLLKTAGQNVLYIYFPFVIIIGCAVVIYFAARWKIPTPLKIMLGIIALLYLPYTLMVVTLLGLFDMVFNYRKLSEKKEEESEKNEGDS